LQVTSPGYSSKPFCYKLPAIDEAKRISSENGMLVERSGVSFCILCTTQALVSIFPGLPNYAALFLTTVPTIFPFAWPVVKLIRANLDPASPTREGRVGGQPDWPGAGRAID
jgi:hypothetical protein